MNATHTAAAQPDRDATTSSDAQWHRGGAWRPAIVFAGVVLTGFGLLYSLAGAGLGRALFPAQAQGSLIVRDWLLPAAAIGS
jgi:hypothetical protein